MIQITKQEAIKQLKAMRSDYDYDMQRFPELVMRDVEALDMAIEALSYSEKPNKSNTIYRQDAINLLDKWSGDYEYIKTEVDLISRQSAIDGFYEMASDLDYLCTGSDYINFLEALPSIQPERKADKSCDGCAFVGCYEMDFPCAVCERRNKDYYTPTPKMEVERRSDE